MTWFTRWFRKLKPDPWIEPRFVDGLAEKDVFDALMARLTKLHKIPQSMSTLYRDEATGQHWLTTHVFYNHWSYDDISPVSDAAAARLLALPEADDPRAPCDHQRIMHAIYGDHGDG